MIQTTIKEIPLLFETEATVFSPSSVDTGTLAMLSLAVFTSADKILDLGCGYGPVGILAAKLAGEKNVILCDSSPEAVRLAQKNAVLNGLKHLDIRQSDAYSSIPESNFTLILSNPPYHTDFSVAKRFIETGFHKLVPGGKIMMVTKRLDWYKNKLTAVFGGVKITEINGYYVFLSEKRDPLPFYKRQKSSPASGLSKKLQRKYKNREKK